MDYLTKFTSALVQKSGLTLPFTLGVKVTFPSSSSQPLYTLHEAIKRDDSSPVSVFLYDFSDPRSRSTVLPLAKNALRKLRTIRHPDVVRFIDVVETDTQMWIMTERVVPLPIAVQAYEGKGKEKEKEEWTIWGMHRICIGMSNGGILEYQK